MKRVSIEKGRDYLEVRITDKQALMGVSRDENCGKWEYFEGVTWIPKVLGPSEEDFRYLNGLVTRLSSDKPNEESLRTGYKEYLLCGSRYHSSFQIGIYNIPTRYSSSPLTERNAERGLNKVFIELTKDSLHFIRLFKRANPTKIFNRLAHHIQVRGEKETNLKELEKHPEVDFDIGSYIRGLPGIKLTVYGEDKKKMFDFLNSALTS